MPADRLAETMGGGLVAAGINVDIDMTFVGQIVIFMFLILVLQPLLFKPVLRVFEEREKRTTGARGEARAMQEKAGELLRRYEAELNRVRRVAAAEREKTRGEAARLEAKILNEAREAANKIVAEGRQRIEKEVNAIRFELGSQSARLAEDIAVMILGQRILSRPPPKPGAGEGTPSSGTPSPGTPGTEVH